MEHDVIKFSGIISAIIVGFFIGLRHSLDGDHVIAVSTMAKDVRSFFGTILIGLSWGLGHSTPLIVIGVLILLLKDDIIDIYEPISSYFELLVSVMLIFLGLQVFWKLFRGNFHFHKHEHDGVGHTHLHNSHIHNNSINYPIIILTKATMSSILTVLSLFISAPYNSFVFPLRI